MVKEEKKYSSILPYISQFLLSGFYNQKKVLNAFKECKVSSQCFSGSTGYGYGDIGRETIEKIYSQIFNTEDSLVRGQFISASHALNVTLFGLLRPCDTMLSICGKPYDTLDEVIGIRENPSSLKSFGVKYEQIDLIDNDFDYDKIENRVKQKNVKLIEIQRSRGYALRNSITLDKIKKVIELLAKEEPLPSRFNDHKLKGGKEFENCRKCHIEPDWLLVYRILKTEIILELLYTGTHSDLF